MCHICEMQEKYLHLDAKEAGVASAEFTAELSELMKKFLETTPNRTSAVGRQLPETHDTLIGMSYALIQAAGRLHAVASEHCVRSIIKSAGNVSFEDAVLMKSSIDSKFTDSGREWLAKDYYSRAHADGKVALKKTHETNTNLN